MEYKFESPICLFERRVKQTPDEIAVRFDTISKTYLELNEDAGLIARHLMKNEVGADHVVGVFMERTHELLASILAIFKARGAYMPLDPAYPHHLLEYMLKKSNCRLLLTNNENEEQAIRISSKIPNLSVVNIHKLESDPGKVHSSAAMPNDLAYIIFTSGTTGRPKGVMIEQKSLVNHLLAKIKDLAIGSKDKVAQTASHCFDISLWQFFSALLVGGTTVIFTKKISTNLQELLQELRRKDISVIQFVPSLLNSFVSSIEQENHLPLPSLRVISTVGEALPPELCRKWLALYSGPHK